QFPSLGRNTDRSVLPSPSKSARALTADVVEQTEPAVDNVNDHPPAIDPKSPPRSSTMYKLQVPFGLPPLTPVKVEVNESPPPGGAERYGAAGAGVGNGS